LRKFTTTSEVSQTSRKANIWRKLIAINIEISSNSSF